MHTFVFLLLCEVVGMTDGVAPKGASRGSTGVPRFAPRLGSTRVRYGAVDGVSNVVMAFPF
jgi:hypothetical protein